MLRVQNIPGPGGVGRFLLAWDMEVPEAYCDATDSAGLPPERQVIAAGTERCALHAAALAPCPVAKRTPPECPHPVVTRPAGPDDLVSCTTCGAGSVPVPERWRRFATDGPAAPQAPDESLAIDAIGDPDADHSSLMTPEAS